MVVAFVGFVGGWAKALVGPEALLAAGVAGAAVATFFTFLPSFVFILVGAPLVESTHGDIRFTAPLTGITAAIVGVIVNLAVFSRVRVLAAGLPAGRPTSSRSPWRLPRLAALLGLQGRHHPGHRRAARPAWCIISSDVPEEELRYARVLVAIET
jgi:chromate transporter